MLRICPYLDSVENIIDVLHKNCKDETGEYSKIKIIRFNLF